MRPLSRSAHPDYGPADPAPSRLAYRLERLWLRKGLRRVLRAGLPLAALAAGAAWYASEPARLDALRERADELRRAVEQRPEFMVELMAVDGASPELAREVRDTVALSFPVSSFDLDLAALRAEIGRIDAVRDVRLRVRPGGLLQVDIVERVPALIWRARDGLMLVDATGHPVAAAMARADWPELPLIAGDGAPGAVDEALALYAAAGPVADRLRGLVRRGERRWDLVLEGGPRVLLPAEAPVPALERLLALDAARDLLSRDLTDIDLRLPDRPTLRLGDHALSELRRVTDPDGAGEATRADAPPPDAPAEYP
ncbi:MAG: cell division protein FtsQ/DivIB [Paracoccaceae bacterium]|nr:cell division protein FtsQ/DivIB [Paracoccaceae bacterium]